MLYSGGEIYYFCNSWELRVYFGNLVKYIIFYEVLCILGFSLVQVSILLDF